MRAWIAVTAAAIVGACGSPSEAPVGDSEGESVDAGEAASTTATFDTGTTSGSIDGSSEGGDGSSSGDDEVDEAAEEQRAIDENWALRVTRAIEAWQLVRSRGREPGEGVLIAHPDTGTSLHPELLEHPTGASPIRWDLARDFVGADALPYHDFEAAVRIPGHGHGTETSSVIGSPLGCPFGGEPGPCVTGAAPAAELVPLRMTESVILLSGDLLADAVDHAIAIDAHVISISMGGVTPMPRLETSIAAALEAGIIVVAAAGNWTGPIVVAPSSMDGVVCVAGVTPELQVWQTSARGERVDIAGPAVDVRFARTTSDAGVLTYDVGLAQGTSDATALTASAAALWLSYHGRDALIERYGAAELPRVFRRLIREAAFFTPPGWPTDGQWGPGILDMVALLEAPLP